MNSTMTERVSTFVGGAVQAMLHMSLCLKELDNLTLFQAALRKEATNRVLFVDEPMSERAQVFRTIVTRYFVTGDSENEVKRALVMALLAGDWERGDVIAS